MTATHVTLQFLFLDRADLPEHTLRSSATSQSLTSRGDIITTTTTTYVKAPDSQGIWCNLIFNICFYNLLYLDLQLW